MISYDKNIFAENLKYFLAANRMTRSELATRLNVSRSIVTEWCSAKKIPRMDKIEAMAKIFNIWTPDLIARDPYDYELDPKKRFSSLTPQRKKELEKMFPNCPRAQWIYYFNSTCDAISDDINHKERLNQEFPENSPIETKMPLGQAEELNTNEIIIRGRDGSCVRKHLTAEQIQAFKTMIESLPDAPDDI